MDLGHAAHHFNWSGWERLIRENGVTIDRPRGSAHPSFDDIVYPIDYGFVNDTVGPDGDEVDVFVGTADTGLVALIVTHDRRKGDDEIKLIYNCRPEEIYLVNGFINFDRKLMSGELIMRGPMRAMW